MLSGECNLLKTVGSFESGVGPSNTKYGFMPTDFQDRRTRFVRVWKARYSPCVAQGRYWEYRAQMKLLKEERRVGD